MSALQLLASYYADNAELTAAVPFEHVWLDTVPSDKQYPYVSVWVISETVADGDWLSDKSCVEKTRLQLSIFSQSAAELDDLAETFKANLDFADIPGATAMIRQGGGMVKEPDIIKDGPPTYHRYLEYVMWITRPAPGTTP